MPQIFLVESLQNSKLLSSPLLLWLSLVAILVYLLFLSILVFKVYRFNRLLFSDIKKNDLKKILQEQIAKMSELNTKLHDLEKAAAKLNTEGIEHLQKIGVVRFNPFEDTGSDQSFVLAILDGKNNGFVFSSLHGRDRTRTYCKPVTNGNESEYPLSKEEREAIEKAKNDSFESLKKG